jgi:hypothetical protein
MSSWRNSISIHPAADLFPLLSEDELAQLGYDIRRNGLTSPIAIMIEHNKPVLVDGRNRLDAMEIVGLRVNLERTSTGTWKLLAYEPTLDGEWVGVPLTRSHSLATVTVVTSDPVEYITSANINRRHLMAETKRDLIAELLREHPERSNRATAKLVGADDKTVAAVRRKEEDVRSIPHVEKVVDTKGRQQPASKPKVSAVKERDDKADRIKQKVRGFCEPLHELHGRLSDLNADSAAVESLLARQARDKVFRGRLAEVVGGLTDLLAKIDVVQAQAPPTVPEQPQQHAQTKAEASAPPKVESPSSAPEMPDYSAVPRSARSQQAKTEAL